MGALRVIPEPFAGTEMFIEFAAEVVVRLRRARRAKNLREERRIDLPPRSVRLRAGPLPGLVRIAWVRLSRPMPEALYGRHLRHLAKVGAAPPLSGVSINSTRNRGHHVDKAWLSRT